MAAYQITDGGVLRERDSAFIPNEPANRDWQDYLAWVGAGNTADPKPGKTLEQEKSDAIAVLQRQFDSRVLALEPRSLAQALTNTYLLREVDMVEADGSPSPADYPMLAALIPDLGADVGAVGTALRTEFDAKAAALAGLENVRRGGATAINAAADSAAVDAALGAVVWP